MLPVGTDRSCYVFTSAKVAACSSAYRGSESSAGPARWCHSEGSGPRGRCDRGFGTLPPNWHLNTPGSHRTAFYVHVSSCRLDFSSRDRSISVRLASPDFERKVSAPSVDHPQCRRNRESPQCLQAIASATLLHSLRFLNRTRATDAECGCRFQRCLHLDAGHTLLENMPQNEC